jgi:hypothetical protein
LRFATVFRMVYVNFLTQFIGPRKLGEEKLRVVLRAAQVHVVRATGVPTGETGAEENLTFTIGDLGATVPC